MWLHFTKMHGLGNDFVVIDCLTQGITINPQQARKLADRHLGIGCDQVLLIEAPSEPDIDFDYRIFNQDGSEVMQCGNGARCFAKFVHDRHLTGKSQLKVRTAAGVMQLSINDNNSYSAELAIPNFEPAGIPLALEAEAPSYQVNIEGNTVEFFALSLGNPHMVILVEDVKRAPVEDWGEFMQQHELFPQQVNVGFMQIISRNEIRLRVYERGVGETLACGSGACAAVVAGVRSGLLEESVLVNLPGGQLQVDWRGPGESVRLTGPAKTVFHGKMRWPAKQTRSATH